MDVFQQLSLFLHTLMHSTRKTDKQTNFTVLNRLTVRTLKCRRNLQVGRVFIHIYLTYSVSGHKQAGGSWREKRVKICFTRTGMFRTGWELHLDKPPRFSLPRQNFCCFLETRLTTLRSRTDWLIMLISQLRRLLIMTQVLLQRYLYFFCKLAKENNGQLLSKHDQSLQTRMVYQEGINTWELLCSSMNLKKHGKDKSTNIYIYLKSLFLQGCESIFMKPFIN